MSRKAHISSLLKLGVSMPVLLLGCGLAWAVHSAEMFPVPSTAQDPEERIPNDLSEADTTSAHKKHINRLAHHMTRQVAYHEKKKHSAVSDGVEAAVPEPVLVVSFSPMPDLTQTKRGHSVAALKKKMPKKALYSTHIQQAHPVKAARYASASKPIVARNGAHILLHLPKALSIAVIADISQLPAGNGLSETPSIVRLGDDLEVPQPVLIHSGPVLSRNASVEPASTPIQATKSPAVVAGNVPPAAFAPLPWKVHAAIAKQKEPASVAQAPSVSSRPFAPLMGQLQPSPGLPALQASSAHPAVTQAETEDAASFSGILFSDTQQQDARALAFAQAGLRPAASVTQEAFAKAGSLVSAEGAGMQIAYNDSSRFGALAPAAGEPASSAPLPPLPTATLTATPLPVLPIATGSAPVPVPLMSVSPVTPAIEASPHDDVTPESLSRQSKAIVNALPPEKMSVPKNKHVTISHAQQNTLDNDDVRQHKGIGISISVRRPKLNLNHMLEEAYDALIAGNQQDAVTLYKEVLAEDPDNKLALFGLATTYHRAGQIELARPLYGRLLAIDPHNQEGLNNFLVLLGDESPSEALEEMRKLQSTHPDFSPLPAQMAVIYEKLGDYDQAIKSMKHAIDLSPENIKYRYDMAVMLDRRGDWEDAAAYYHEIIMAFERGEKIPANEEEIQERLTFIRSNKPAAQPMQQVLTQP